MPSKKQKHRRKPKHTAKPKNGLPDLSSLALSPPSTFPFTSLPPEIIQRIAIIAFSSPQPDHLSSLRDISGFELFATLNHAIRDIIRGENGCTERFYERMMVENFALGRPKEMRGDSWRQIAKLALMPMAKALKTEGTYHHYFFVAKPERLPVPHRLKERFIEGPGPNAIMFNDKHLGPMPKAWEPPTTEKLIRANEADGKLIMVHSTGVLTTSILLPLSIIRSPLPGGLLRQGETRPVLETPAVYPVQREVSFGMHFVSTPPMTRMTFLVFLGWLEIGRFEVGNREGVTMRDLDIALSEFLESPIPSKQKDLLSRLIPTLAFHPPFLPHVPPPSSLPWRAFIHRLARPQPRLVDFSISGKGILVFEPPKEEDAGRMHIKDMEEYYRVGEKGDMLFPGYRILGIRLDY